jgi:acetoin utilization protein AcuB
VRVTCSIQEKPGQVARLTQAIAEKGGNIVAFVTAEGDDLSWRRVTLKVTGISRAEAENIVKGLGDVELEDIRE